MLPVASGTAVRTLIRAFDDELSCDLERLCALSIERFASFRSIICLRFLHALPLRDAKALGRLAHQRNDPPRSDDTGHAPGSLGRRLGLRSIRGKGRGI